MAPWRVLLLISMAINMPMAIQAGTPAFSEKKMSDLRQSMAWSLKMLKPFRQNRLRALKHFVGKNYSDTTAERVPINMVWLAVSIYLRQLVPSVPNGDISTSFPQLKPVAADLTIALNHLLQEMQYAKTSKLVLMEAMFCMGIMKVGLEVRDVGNDMGVDHDAGQPFADLVTLDSWVHDMTARDYNDASYAGDRYSMTYELAMDTYKGPARDRLLPRQNSSFGYYGGSDKGAESLSQGNQSMVDEYGKFVDLWDIWLPRENLFVTISADEQSGPPLEVREWEGPERGPYHLLRFQPLPDNVMPIGPVMQWLDLADSVNKNWRKLGRQAERQKEVTFVQGNASIDGHTVKNADDGDIVTVNNPAGIHTERYGGIDQQNLGFVINSKNTLAYMMGNIDAVGGLAAQTSTLGQDQMLSQGANRMIDDMRQSLASFNSEVFRDLAMYMWEDPYIQLPLVKRSGSVDIPFRWTPESREGDFSQYNFDVEPFSQRITSPEEKLAKLNEVMTSIVIPSGMEFDPQKYMRAISRLLGSKELEEIMNISPGVTPVNAHGGGNPNTTTRRYERVSRAGPSTKGADDQMLQQSLMGGQSQGQQPGGQMQ